MKRSRQARRYLPFIALLAVVGCAHTEDAPECEELTYACNLNVLSVCRGGSWQSVQECASDQMCDSIGGKCAPKDQDPDCINGTYKCNADNHLVLCNSGAWHDIQNCNVNNQVCNADTKQCEDNGTAVTSCTEGQRICRDNSVYECKDDNYQLVQACSKEQTCNSSTYQCDDQERPVCVDGAAKCAGTTPMLCSGNAWIPQRNCDANESCNSVTGSCDQVKCASGVARCNGSTLTYCDPNGQEVTVPCPSGTICDERRGECVNPDLGKCTVNGNTIGNGESMCNGDDLVFCNYGRVNTQKCGFNQVCRKNATECTDYEACTVGDGKVIAHGMTACSEDGKKIVRCNDGKLENETACTGSQICMVSGSAYSCAEPPAAACSLKGTTIPQGSYICDDNKLRFCASDKNLTDGVDCSDNKNGKSLCSGDACVAALCKMGTETIASGLKVCSEDRKKIMQCEDGELKSVSNCDSKVCQVEGSTPTCVDNGKSYTTIAQIWNDFSLYVDSSCSSNAGSVKPASVKITGVITYLNSSGYLFVQDPSVSNAQRAGIMINCAGGACDPNAMKQLSVGKQVTVTADGIGQSYCQLQVRGNKSGGISISSSGSGSITPYGVDVRQINSQPNNVYNSSLVKVSDLRVLSATNGGYMAKDSSGEFTISTEAYGGTLENGSKYNVSGIVRYVGNASVLMPRSAVDIQKFECTGSSTKCESLKLYTCSNGKWNSGVACTTSDPNANAVCYRNACSTECKPDYYLKGDKCEVIESSKENCIDAGGATVKHGAKGCSSATGLATCNDGSWTYASPCDAPDNADASCKSGACSWTCRDGFEKIGDLCVAKQCHGKGGVVASGRSGCSNTGYYAQCMNGQWVNQQPCPLGCDPEINACKSKDSVPVEWCYFNYLDVTNLKAYSQVRTKELNEAGITFTPVFKCTNTPNTPVLNWKSSVTPELNPGCATCGSENSEYMTQDKALPAEEGSHTCVAMVEVKGGHTYLCPNRDDNAFKPVLVDSTTVPIDYQTRTYNVEPATANPLKWCKFGIYDGIAYIQFLPPDGMTADDVTARTVCTSSLDNVTTKPIAGWEKSIPTSKKNESCMDCGTDNTEYMTNSGDLPSSKGWHYCVGLVSVKNGNTYVCPTNSANAPVYYDNATMADDPYPTQWGYQVE